MADQLSAVDLDALERHIQDSGSLSPLYKRELVGVIQRLREAEADSLQARNDMLVEENRADLALARIAQLERVREAAYEVHDTARYEEDASEPWRVDTDTFEALIDVLRLTENPTTHKAG